MAEGRRRAPSLLVGLLWAASLAYCFNLEPRSAHIYGYPYAGTQEREAYFGYSVALQHDDKQGSNWWVASYSLVLHIGIP